MPYGNQVSLDAADRQNEGSLPKNLTKLPQQFSTPFRYPDEPAAKESEPPDVAALASLLRRVTQITQSDPINLLILVHRYCDGMTMDEIGCRLRRSRRRFLTNRLTPDAVRLRVKRMSAQLDLPDLVRVGDYR